MSLVSSMKSASSVIALRDWLHHQSSGGEKNCTVYCFFCVFIIISSSIVIVVVVVIIIIIIIITTIIIIFFLVLLNCLFLNPRVLLFIHSPPHPTRGMSEQLSGPSCQLPV